MQTLLIEEVKQRLEQTFSPQALDLVDASAAHVDHAGNQGGAHLHLTMHCKSLAHLRSVEQHKLVYHALADLLEKKIHALSIQIDTH